MLIIDSHQDLAWNILAHGRDYTRSVMETRQIEAGTSIPNNSGDSIVGWPEYQRGKVAIVFSTLYATPAKKMEREIRRTFSFRVFPHAVYVV